MKEVALAMEKQADLGNFHGRSSIYVLELLKASGWHPPYPPDGEPPCVSNLGLVDAWGRPLEFRVVGRQLRIISLGENGSFEDGQADDLALVVGSADDS